MFRLIVHSRLIAGIVPAALKDWVQAEGLCADEENVERRKQARFEINQDVTVTVLGREDGAPFPAVALEMSGSGLRLRSPQPIAYQAAVQVEASDWLLLGEVVRVEACAEGCIVALKLQHSLSSLGDLHRLSRSLRWESEVLVL